MSIRVVGGAGGNPVLVPSYTLPATIIAKPRSTVTPNPPLPPAAPLVKTLVMNGNITSSPDLPGMSSISVKVLTSPEQANALRSAAANTAQAFHLPVKISADRATKLQNQEIVNSVLIPPIVIDEVVIPS